MVVGAAACQVIEINYLVRIIVIGNFELPFFYLLDLYCSVVWCADAMHTN